MFESKYGCKIRAGRPEDLDEAMRIYGCAKAYMDANGNPNQWVGYPTRDLIAEDMEKEQCYVCIAEDGRLCGVFAFILGQDETYLHIEDGHWLNDRPYGTIHRIASDGSAKGVFSSCLEFCRSVSDEIRIDTHADNSTMRHLIEKSGFQRCGIIYVRDGSPRIAYQLPTDGGEQSLHYTIDLAIPPDLPEVVQLCRRIAATPDCTWSDDYPIHADLLVDLTDGALYVIRCAQGQGKKQIIGCAGAAPHRDIDTLSCWSPAIQRPCCLAHFGIHPSYQRRGLAEALLAHIESDALQRGYDGIHFLVSKSNDAALSLYRKHGYRCCGESDLFDLDWFCYEKQL